MTVVDSALSSDPQSAEDDLPHAPHTPPGPLPSREILEQSGELLRALAAPVRIAIVLQLRESQRCVHELVDAVGVAQPLISQHLRVLKSAGVVSGERQGREVMYRLVDDHLSHIVVDAVAHAEEQL
ncbi:MULTISPECIES: metalloregulator ArsR/SmtB family transcription factor [unclassified Mycobacteroides]|uniref:ArsR/SmtB family transcription factor n=1 Tax=unclassified Mycobacteroides TaxID=2618759 RepID=UPI0012DF76CF